MRKINAQKQFLVYFDLLIDFLSVV